MKKRVLFMTFFLGLFFLSQCALNTEEQRFIDRFNSFYSFLEPAEKKAFVTGDYNEFGQQLYRRLENNKKLSEQWENIKHEEAIATFSEAQVARFYHEILLREINRKNYYRLMKYLDAPLQFAFARGKDITSAVKKKLDSDKRFASFWKRLRTRFELKDFNDSEILRFFYEVNYPEASRKEVYYLLKVLNEANALQDFVAHKTDQAAQILEKKLNDPVFYSLQLTLEEIQKRSGLTDLNISDFLKVYDDVIFRQMDKEAARKTLLKFIKG